MTGEQLLLGKNLEKELSDLPEGWIVLLETSAEKILEVSLAVIKILTDKNYTGLVISANRPCNNLLSLYEKNSINTKKVMILCAICKSQGGDAKNAENIIHLERISALTDMSISLSEAIKKTKGNKFIFIDSITTMLIHNQPNVFAIFIHSILTKMRMDMVSGLLISLENETNREVRADIAQLCDRVIKV